VSLILLPYFTNTSHTSARLLSTEGRSYAFDQRATEGYGRGEGAVSLILKPLDKAEAEGDHIYALIRHTGINQDGKTTGITMPSVGMQIALMDSVYRAAKLDPQDTGYVEAHGTGTSVGDPIEATAIGKVFGRTAGRGVTYIGSIKSNFGHLEGPSGLLGILKTAMMLERSIVLPNYDFQTPNPNVPLDEYRLKVSIYEKLLKDCILTWIYQKVPSDICPWPATKCRRASVNNLGYGGSNGHVIMEQAPHKILKRTETASFRRLYPVSAADKNALARQVALTLEYVLKQSQAFHQFILDDLAYTLAARRSFFSWRTTITATDTTDLIAQLSNFNAADMQKSRDSVSIAFAFTGQGAHWTGMGRELMAYPVYRDSIREIDQILESLGGDRSVEGEYPSSGYQELR
jgi:acyl transferase domain-containing protein